MRSRALCPVYNGHSAPKLEEAVLEYLGQYSDPQLVRDYLSAIDQKELERHETELRDVEKRLADYEARFITRLDDLLKREILSEQEFARANQAARAEKVALETRATKLKDRIDKERVRTAMANTLPQSITTFLGAFEGLEIRQQKAHLQTILKAARVYRDGRIELEFRQWPNLKALLMR